jgi:TolA-binding protein
MESMKTKLRELDGSLAEIRHDLDQFGKSVDSTNRRVNEFAIAAGIDLPIDESKVPSNPKDHFGAIETAFAEGRYSETRALGKVFAQRHGRRGEADNVQLLIAKSYSRQKRWAKSLGVLHRFSDNYPKSDLQPEALYEMANAFYHLGGCTDARILIDTIISRYKRSEFANKARELIKLIKKNKSRCTS